MTPEPAEALPDIGVVIAPMLAQIPRQQQPLLIALAERQAAQRYRGWAAEFPDPARRAQLLACADREDEIARRVEALHPEASATQRDLEAKHPGLATLGSLLFDGRPLREQFTIQARGERLGSATWQAFARASSGPAQQTYLACAELEERSAEVLEALLAAGV
jgi:hypothetical protein